MTFKKKISIVIIYTLIVAVTVVAGIGVRSFINSTPFEGTDNFTVSQIEEVEGNVKFNVLIVGVDKTEGLSDVIMVARFDEENKKISAMSIPRDTYVRYKGSVMLVNSVYGYGGIEAVSKVVTELTGLGINYYVQFGVGTFARLVDLLGGVEFNVPQNMHYDDPVQDLHIHLNKGLQTLDGEEAEGLVRFRGYPQADLKRVEVQQDLLKELVKQKVSVEYITKIPSVYEVLKEDIKCNMSLKEMLMYAKAMLGIDLNDGVYTCTMPTMMTGVDAHLYQDKVETDKIIENEFNDDGPIIGNKPYNDN